MLFNLLNLNIFFTLFIFSNMKFLIILNLLKQIINQFLIHIKIIIY